MALLIYDEHLAKQFRAKLDEMHPDCPYEVWEGDVVVSPSASDGHNSFAVRLNAALSAVIDWDAGDDAVGPCNVSDRGPDDWMQNYRIPDVAVFLRGNTAVNHGAYRQGGPDAAVEIISPRENPHAKLGFYAAIGTRELLLIFRDPWRLEVWQLRDGVMRLSADVGLGDAPAASAVLPVTYSVRQLSRRPGLVLTHTTTGQVWQA